MTHGEYTPENSSRHEKLHNGVQECTIDMGYLAITAVFPGIADRLDTPLRATEETATDGASEDRARQRQLAWTALTTTVERPHFEERSILGYAPNGRPEFDLAA